MAGNYIDTPGTERVDATSFSHAGELDFSIAQPFASPSKNPAEDLRNQMRGLRNGRSQPQTMQTPRMRNPLLNKRNPAGAARQEFTPLLKSARRNQLLRQSMIEEKENSVNHGVPDTPAGFRSSYASEAHVLPIDSSMMDNELTGSSAPAIDATPIAPAATSSMLSSTPTTEVPRRENGILEHGNVLTLRDQEAKLDEIQKTNFSLKLKIHYLEDALRKSGTEFQQATLKENVELKTEKMTVLADLKKQHKRVKVAEQELEEYRIKLAEYKEQIKKRHTHERDNEEVERLERLAEESRIAAEERLQEVEEMKQRLEEAEQSNNGQDEEELQNLRDDIQDLEREIRDRDGQLDAKDEELEALKEKLRSADGSAEDVEQLQQEIDNLDAEIKEKDDELEEKKARIAELEERVNTVYDREKSTKKLRLDAPRSKHNCARKTKHWTRLTSKCAPCNKNLDQQSLNSARRSVRWSSVKSKLRPSSGAHNPRRPSSARRNGH
jgi:myosin heavy subunit